MNTGLILTLVVTAIVSLGTLVYVLIDERKKKEIYDEQRADWEKEQELKRAAEAAARKEAEALAALQTAETQAGEDSNPTD
jgi:hypothetical protein